MNINPEAKRILCYGDSNTWGQNPDGTRYNVNQGWPGVLQIMLGNGYEIIEEGLCGRTTNVEGNIKGDSDKNGLTHFAPILASHLPINSLVISLGTNDLKQRFNRSALDIALGLELIIQQVDLICAEYNTARPNILILSPALVKEDYIKPPYKMKGSEEKSKEFHANFLDIALRNNAQIINLAEFIESSDVDGIHLDQASHLKIAELVKSAILTES